MNIKREKLEKLTQAVYDTQDDEIHCDRASTLIGQCADALLSDEEAQRRFPALWHHFRFCLNCVEEYEAVMTLARMQEAGQIAPPENIPPVPDQDKLSGWRSTADAVNVLFPGFSPMVTVSITRGEDTFVEPVEVTLEENIHLSLDVTVNERNPALRDLFCTILTTDETATDSLEGSPVWLQFGDEGPATYEGALNELGDVAFTQLPPGECALRIHLRGKKYHIVGISLP